MYNWSVDTKRIKKDKLAYEAWRLEQLINYGLGAEKLPTNSIKKHLNNLNIDPYKRNYLRFLLK